MKSPTLLTASKILLGCSLISLAPRAEVIKQDFNSMAELNAFWDISTWGNDNRVHSAQNVSIDNGILVLKLSGSQPGQLPVCAEIASKRSDFKYGSYRASIKSSMTPGAVVGWFIYRDSPLNEIDVEMLTREINHVYFTLHHIVENVDDKTLTITYDPTAAFHEYRFDWYADKVDYYIDSKLVGTLTKSVPDMSAAIMLNHWSGNIAGWGGAAPTKDMFMYVDYMYYSSDYSNTTPITTATAPEVKMPAFSQARISQSGHDLVLPLDNRDAAHMGALPTQVSLYSLGGKNLMDVRVSAGDVARGLLRMDTRGLRPGTYVAMVSGLAGVRSQAVAIMEAGAGGK